MNRRNFLKVLTTSALIMGSQGALNRLFADEPTVLSFRRKMTMPLSQEMLSMRWAEYRSL